MNKTKMMLAVTGGVIGVAVLVMAFFVWSSYSAKTAALEGDEEEGVEGLETVLSRAQTLSRKPVYPSAESLAAIESNRTVLTDWQTDATKLARRGDRVYEKTTSAAFKEFLVRDAKRLAALPGRAEGMLAKPTFAFGPFKDYISGGKLPAEAELADLQRKWDDVVTIVEILAQSGVAELTDIAFADEAAKTDANAAQNAKNKKPNAKAKKNNKKGDAEAEKLEPKVFAYTFTFTTKPNAFVKALNTFVTSERFITVEGFSFTRPSDVITDALGAGEKKAGGASAQQGGRRRRRGAVAVEEKKDEKDDPRHGIVTDPILDDPFTVVLKVNVRDFRSLEENKTEEAK